MKKKMTASDFVNEWPESRKEDFSYSGLCALYDYLTEFEDDTGQELEYDPIAFCRKFSEYKSALDAVEDVAGLDKLDIEEGDDADEIAEAALEWLQDRTTIIEVDSPIIIGEF